MGIESFIKKICVQTAVYWGNPIPDGYGGMLFDDPVEIKVRWDIKNKVVISKDGKEVTSVATILTPEDLQVEGRLYLGFMVNLLDSDDSSGGISDPSKIDNTFEIIAFEKVSMIKSLTQFVRTVYV
jgi:hypothetical protein